MLRKERKERDKQETDLEDVVIKWKTAKVCGGLEGSHMLKITTRESLGLVNPAVCLAFLFTHLR